MKLNCTISKFIPDAHPSYNSFIVNYTDGKDKRMLLVRGYAETTKGLQEGGDYVMHIRIESTLWGERYSTSAFLLKVNKKKSYNPNYGFDRKGFETAIWKNDKK